ASRRGWRGRRSWAAQPSRPPSNQPRPTPRRRRDLETAGRPTNDGRAIRAERPGRPRARARPPARSAGDGRARRTRNGADSRRARRGEDDAGRDLPWAVGGAGDCSVGSLLRARIHTVEGARWRRRFAGLPARSARRRRPMWPPSLEFRGPGGAVPGAHPELPTSRFAGKEEPAVAIENAPARARGAAEALGGIGPARDAGRGN